MIDLKPSISTIEALIAQNTAASLTYAALECRLAIERICYDRLRVSHEYISHDDLKKWQPRDIVNTLIQEVDANSAAGFTLFIGKEPLPDAPQPPTLEEYQKMQFFPVGTQAGFSPNKLGKLWNALAKLALHISLPTHKDDSVARYGDTDKIRSKVKEALKEIQRINEGTLLSSGMGEQVSFQCVCGTNNKRRIELLEDRQIISCINPDCDESFAYIKQKSSFSRRLLATTCQKCGKRHEIPMKKLERLRTDHCMHFVCEECQHKNFIKWKLMIAQKTLPTQQD